MEAYKSFHGFFFVLCDVTFCFIRVRALEKQRKMFQLTWRCLCIYVSFNAKPISWTLNFRLNLSNASHASRVCRPCDVHSYMSVVRLKLYLGHKLKKVKWANKNYFRVRHEENWKSQQPFSVVLLFFFAFVRTAVTIIFACVCVYSII